MNNIYRIKHPDGRIVTKHKRFDRYYVQYSDFCDKELEVFETENIEEAKSVLEATRRAWTDDFEIVRDDKEDE